VLTFSLESRHRGIDFAFLSPDFEGEVSAAIQYHDVPYWDLHRGALAPLDVVGESPGSYESGNVQ
jgi:hypothetical protein